MLEPFRQRFPGRFLNVGVSEQNMIGLAAGLARSSYIPFVYSISTFAALRPYEFARNGPIHHEMPVRIVGVGDGFDYGVNGFSHYGLDDVAVMRVQPGLTLIAPADSGQAASALKATWNLPGPVYYHLGTDDRVTVPGLDGRFELGRTQTLRNGSDVVMLAMGPVAAETVAAADMLAGSGVACAVSVIASIRPAPERDLVAILSGVPLALTVESRYTTGGLGSLVCEVAAGHGLACRVVRCGVEGLLPREVGCRDFLRARHGLSAAALAARVSRELAVGSSHAELR